MAKQNNDNQENYRKLEHCLHQGIVTQREYDIISRAMDNEDFKVKYDRGYMNGVLRIKWEITLIKHHGAPSWGA